MSTAYPYKTLVRFWIKVKKTETCWFWTGGLDSHDYPHFWLDGKYVGAHRLSYELAKGTGSIPAGHELHHRCGKRRCIRPEHLQPMDRDSHLALHGLPPTMKRDNNPLMERLMQIVGNAWTKSGSAELYTKAVDDFEAYKQRAEGVTQS